MSNTSMTNSKKFTGGIFWGIIFFIVYWYWNCSDGIRIVKNMHVYEIFHEEIIQYLNKKVMPLAMSQPVLESMGYNTDITFEEAIKRTNPKKVVFEAGSSELPEFRGKSVTPVNVTVTYDPPLDGKYSSITMIIGVQKEWFFHFNPVPIAPATTMYYEKGKSNIVSLPQDSNLIVAEPIFKYFRENI